MYFDLEHRLRTDSQFRQEVRTFQERLAVLEPQVAQDPARLAEYRETVRRLVEHCRFNLVLLTPYFWPAYPERKPLVYSNYPYAFHLFNVQIGGFTVIRGSRQISKSTSFACRQQMLAHLLPRFRSLYIAPQEPQLKTYQNRFSEVVQANRFFQRDTRLRQNLGYKEYANGSVVEMASVLTSAAGIRGKSTDELLFDEFQNFDPELELEVLQTQSASERPTTIYAGTSLTSDTALEDRWNQSSQASWVMQCEACKHRNFPLLDCGIIDMIQPLGVCCAKCGKLLNVRQGEFIHADEKLRDAGYLGFHIPQLIVPAVVSNRARWAEINRMKAREGGSRQFRQEVLGIATEEGEREITRQQLAAICTLGSDLEGLRQKAAGGEYRWVVSGCDWGGSDYIPAWNIKKSTTVHVIMGILPTGQFDILHFWRYSGMDYDGITEHILHNHNAYRGFALASDFGVGAVYNSNLRKQIPAERHLIFGYTGPTTALLAEPEGPHMYNQYSLNKTESITLAFEAIRRQRIRCFSWDIAQEYLEDCLNLFRAPGERGYSGSGASSGMSTFLYRSHPSKPNDALMAVNYAFTLGKLVLGEPVTSDHSVRLRLEASFSGACPGGVLYPNLPGAISE
jgi:hypothetical protein